MTLGPNISSDADHLFQSDANLAAQQRRAQKKASKSKAGNPIQAGSKILALSIVDDGRSAYVAESGFAVRKLNLEDGKTLRLLKGHAGPVTCVSAFVDSNGNEVVLSGSWDKTLKRWSHESSTTSISFAGHADFVKCLVVSPDASRMWSGSSDATIREWDLKSGECTGVWKGHTRAVEDMKLGEDGAFLYSCSSDCSIRKWDVRTGAEVLRLDGHLTSVYSLIIENGDLWSTSADKTTKRWDLETHKEDSSYDHPDFVKCIAVAGKWVFTGSRDENIRVFNVATGKCSRTIEGHFDEVSCMVVVGNDIVTGSLDGTIRRWPIDGVSSDVVAAPVAKAKEAKPAVSMTADEEAELADLMDDE